MSSADDTDDYVSKTRERAVQQLSPEGKSSNDLVSDRDITIKEIHALIIMNNEIIEFIRKTSLNPIIRGYHQRFLRTDYNRVKIWNMAGMTQIVAFQEIVAKSFNTSPLFLLPPGLNIFETKRTRLGLIDFESILTKSLMLHDDILTPFLQKLRDHLEQAQVCLGAIHTWLLRSEDNAKYLETMFGVELTNIAMTSSQSKWCRCGNHQLNAICRNCRCCYIHHHPNSDSSRRCPGAQNANKLFCCTDDFLILAEYNMGEMHEASFNIDRESERVQFKMLCDYLMTRYKSCIGSVLECSSFGDDVRNLEGEPAKKMPRIG